MPLSRKPYVSDLCPHMEDEWLLAFLSLVAKGSFSPIENLSGDL
jgi:hypothetical protein